MTRRHRTGKHNSESGMTLLEIMISMAIMMTMLGIGWSTFGNSVGLKRSSEKIDERYHEIRIGIARMVDDLSSAYISSNEDQQLDNRRTLFIGKEASDVDELRFSTMSHRVLWADANESEQTMVYYFAEKDKEDSGKTNLLRRESRRLSNEQWENEPGEIDVLIRNIEDVHFEYWNWQENEWRNNWDSTQADGQGGKIPSRVRIVVELKRGNDDIVKFTSQARIMLQEELRLFTN